MNIEFSAKLDTKVVLNRYILEKKGLACFPSGQLFSDLNSTNRCVGKYNIVLYFHRYQTNTFHQKRFKLKSLIVIDKIKDLILPRQIE